MTVTIQIPADVESRLRTLAEAEGADLPAYVSKIVQQAAARPSVDAILEPLRREFAESGMTDEELIGQITEARKEYRGGAGGKSE